MTNLTSTRWFIMFINDHTRIYRVYLMREKSEAKRIFKEFHNIVKNQFQTQIQVSRTNNRKKYLNTILSPFLKD